MQRVGCFMLFYWRGSTREGEMGCCTDIWFIEELFVCKVEIREDVCVCVCVFLDIHVSVRCRE